MSQLYEKALETTNFIEEKLSVKPSIGLILGSGLGDLADEIEESVKIAYEDIPNFPVSTVEGHKGQLVIGKLNGKQVIAMQGRFHFYEGYSMEQVTFPVRVMKLLGVSTVIITNACGGMNPSFSPGDLMIITDHINMTGTNPLIGENDSRFGARFPDMSSAYTKKYIKTLEGVANQIGLELQQGVYAGITGPTYMTAAELIMLRKMGGDVIGMSTVPEVIVASHMNMDVIGISCITDMAIGEDLEGVTHEQVMEIANRTKPKFIQLVKEVLPKI